MSCGIPCAKRRGLFVSDRLRPFQRATVDLVSHRFWHDVSPAKRFLVADEVGLGKTLVARGIVEQGLAWAGRQNRPFRVVYICANAVLAQQNRARLFRGLLDPITRDRLTMLADGLPRSHDHAAVAFTPMTSFHLKQRLGMAEERALLLSLCIAAGWPNADTAAARNVFLGRKDVGLFDALLKEWQPRVRLSLSAPGAGFDERVLSFLRIGGKESASHALSIGFRDLLKQFPQYKSAGDENARGNFVADLRRLVSRAVLQALSPDLVILDEFQRFRYLIDGTIDQDEGRESEMNAREVAARELACDLLDGQARVLLLSATPFRPFTHADEESDHWSDFSRVMTYLLEPAANADLHDTLEVRRKALLADDREGAQSARIEAETIMRQAISRHERVAATHDGNAMLRTRGENPAEAIPFTSRAAQDAWSWIRLARAVRHRDSLSLWASAPYGMHFLDGYQFSEKIIEQRRTARGREQLAGLLSTCNFATLPSTAKLTRYAETPCAHSTLNWLLDETVNAGWWRMPWLPPSATYWKLSGPFANRPFMSKRLLFSGWRAVPKAVAALVSYSAEQLAVAEALHQEASRQSPLDDDEEPANRWWAKATSKAPTTFRFMDGPTPRWSLLTLVYPSRFLATLGSQFAMARTDPLNVDAMLQQLRELLIPAVDLLPSGSGSAIDRRWYGLAPVLLDHFHGGIESCDQSRPEDSEHIDSLLDLLSKVEATINELGRRPDDLIDVLALLAVASPAISARRSLSRCLETEEGVPARAACVGLAFARYLEKRPHVIAIKADHAFPLWRGVLMRSLEGCLQAVLDEQVHLLVADGLSLDEVTNDLITSLELRPAVVEATVPPYDRDANAESHDHFRFRTHFAVRFGAKESVEGGDEPEIERLRRVRSAFNAPWWPFILATTSIGQEGLDFHRWCSSVVHWNLPWNPVDLEQREGRVHRYRNLAVRRNLAASQSAALNAAEPDSDPWEILFASVPQEQGGMVPDWLFPGPSSIERIIPLLPMTQERQRFYDLSKLLTNYRALLGQPRQEEILRNLSEEQRSHMLNDSFNLTPRRVDPK